MRQLMARQSPLQKPTPTVAPVMHCVVENEELEARGHDDGDDAAHLHGEAARGRLQREAVAQVLHDVVAVRPETDDDADTSEGEDPGGDVVRAVLGEDTRVPDLVDGGIRSNGTIRRC